VPVSVTEVPAHTADAGDAFAEITNVAPTLTVVDAVAEQLLASVPVTV